VHEGSEQPDTTIDREIAVRGLGSYERLQRKARERGFTIVDRAEDGPAEIELWAP
jgi:hypothetical protein